MRPKQNPFQARPSFYGRSARFKWWEGGFHTALDKDFAAAYAYQKYMSSPFNEHPGVKDTTCLDPPVVLTFDMAGKRAFADIDGRRAAVKLLDVIEANVSLSLIEEDTEAALAAVEDTFRGFDEPTFEAGDQAENALFATRSASSEEVAMSLFVQNNTGAGDFVNFLRIAETLKGNERAKLDEADEADLIRLFQQAVFYADVEDARLLKVEFMRPFLSSVVVGEPGDTDEEELLEEILDQGYALFTVEDGPDFSFQTMWKREHKKLPMGFAAQKPRVEHYHGTVLSNLLRAAPWLAKELPAEWPGPCAEGDLIRELAREMAKQPTTVGRTLDDEMVDELNQLGLPKT